jgi:DNA-binding IclR family transcriptional regulator
MTSESTIRSVVTSLRVLQAFTPTDRVLGVSELARRLGLGKSTVHRALQTLAGEGFVIAVPGGRYRLGLKLYELGQHVAHANEIRDPAHHHVRALQQRTGETVQLAVLDGADVVAIDRVESPDTLRTLARTGFRSPAHASAAGRAILAHSDAEVVTQAIGAAAVGPAADPSAVRTALDRARDDGYAVSSDDAGPGLNAVGAPVFDPRGRVVAGLALVAPAARLPTARLRETGLLVRRSADEITRDLGSRTTAPTSRRSGRA